MPRCVIIPNKYGKYTDGNSFFNLIMVDDWLNIATLHQIVIAETEEEAAAFYELLRSEYYEVV